MSDEEMVLTPGGLHPKSQVHTVPFGGRVHHTDDEVQLIDKDGNILHREPRPKSLEVGAHDPPKPMASGWITYANWYNNTGDPICSFDTTWTVPPAPTTNNGQTIFLFNSIEPGTYNAILQPVLQWGPSYAGGGAFWTVASWYLVGS